MTISDRGGRVEGSARPPAPEQNPLLLALVITHRLKRNKSGSRAELWQRLSTGHELRGQPSGVPCGSHRGKILAPDFDR